MPIRGLFAVGRNAGVLRGSPTNMGKVEETVTTEQTLGLLLVDDHALFREGLARVLESHPDFEVRGKASSATEALELLSTTEGVDIVILDVDLGQERALDFVERCRPIGYTGKILIVTAGVSEREALQYVQHGVSGILHKQHSPETLCAAIRRVARGEVHLEPSYLRVLFQTVDTSSPPQRAHLTDRDIKVMRHVLQGLANKEIGAQLNISESATKASLRTLFDKLGVRTRSQLVRVALEQYRDYL
jgi:two-component system, NarL family, nitrate/nitrite response regulator NarL